MSIISLSLKFSIDCAHCGETLPINKAAEKILCDRCGEETLTPLVLWQKLVTEHLVDASTLKPETDTWANGMLAGVGSYSMVFGNMLPRCTDGCGAIWPLDSVLEIAEKEHTEFCCTGCGKIWSVRKPPEWFDKVIPYAKFLVGEESPGDTGGKIEGGEEGISIHCYHCGGSLSLDGSSRKVTCQYCGQDLLIPDDIWSRLHPVTAARPWFILLDMGENVDLLPYDIDDFIDLEAMPNGDTVLLWEQNNTGHIGLANRTGGLRWHTKEFTLSDYARLLYDRQNHTIWVLEHDEHLVYAFEADTGREILRIKNKKENSKQITACDHEGIAISTDGSIVVYRRWGGEEANEPKRFIPNEEGELVSVEDYVFYANTLRRFDTQGNRIPLWEGFSDEDLTYREEVRFEELTNQPTVLPEETWLMGGPDNVLYVLDRTNGRIARFDRHGILLESIKPKLKGVARIQDCGVAGNGTTYILFDHEKDIGESNFSHVGKISPDGSFRIIAGPLNDVNNFPLGTDMERMAVAENGELHLCDYNFNNFRILTSDGSHIWRSPGTVKEDETLAEELAEEQSG
ncbi:MAG: hypothetical protein E3J87_04030 [Candidatus Cloacimonadota bacterium]|nr:MAG: hypothetical protein E3J87_04030 [Candidatus Cloacimonadota bacterium]